MPAALPARPAWPDLPNFDGAVFAKRGLLGPLDSFVLRVAPNHVEPTEELLRLREGPVGHEPPSGFEPDVAGLAIPAQALSMDHLTSSLQLSLEALVAVKDRLDLGPLARCGLVDVDEQYIAHDSLLSRSRRRPPEIASNGDELAMASEDRHSLPLA